MNITGSAYERPRYVKKGWLSLRRYAREFETPCNRFRRIVPTGSSAL
jgi:hypothetical protein